MIILINALIYLRIPVQINKENKKTFEYHENTFGFFNADDDDAMKEEQSMKLVMYSIGYVASWNVISGDVDVLKELPLVEQPGSFCK